MTFNTHKDRVSPIPSPVVQVFDKTFFKFCFNFCSKNWMTAQKIRIELVRPNVWPASSSGLKPSNSTLVDAYQFAISDIKIGGHCQCNGHADRLVMVELMVFEQKYIPVRFRKAGCLWWRTRDSQSHVSQLSDF